MSSAVRHTLGIVASQREGFEHLRKLDQQGSASMKEHEFKLFQGVLERQRQETLRSINRAQQEGRGLQADFPQDPGDRSVINFSKELLFQQSTQKRQLLRHLETALRRIREGTFGQCLCCGDEIGVKRLEAVPFTSYCRECQDNLERKRTVEDGRMADR